MTKQNILLSLSLATSVFGLTIGAFAINNAVNDGPLTDKQTGEMVLASLLITHAAVLPLYGASKIQTNN